MRSEKISLAFFFVRDDAYDGSNDLADVRGAPTPPDPLAKSWLSAVGRRARRVLHSKTADYWSMIVWGWSGGGNTHVKGRKYADKRTTSLSFT